MRELTFNSPQNFLFPPKWSQRIIILGKGVPGWSKKYKRLIKCMAGVGEGSGLLRLFPFFHNQEDIDIFDVIQVAFRKKKTSRKDSCKILPNTYRVVDRLPKKDRKELIESLVSPSHLHKGTWLERSLTVVKPENIKVVGTKVHFECGYNGCSAHIMELFPQYIYDSVGRRRWLNKDQFGNECYFLLGTVKKHPSKWIIVSIFSGGKELKSDGGV